MAQSGVAYELQITGLPPLYVVGCAEPSSDIFQQAANLLHDQLSAVGSSASEIRFDSAALHEPGEDLRDIADTLGQRQIFDDYQFFRVATVRDWMAVGVGTNSKKLERASKLALAVTLAMQLPHPSVWLEQHNVMVFEDPLPPLHDAPRDPPLRKRHAKQADLRQATARQSPASASSASMRAPSKKIAGMPVRGKGPTPLNPVSRTTRDGAAAVSRTLRQDPPSHRFGVKRKQEVLEPGGQNKQKPRGSVGSQIKKEAVENRQCPKATASSSVKKEVEVKEKIGRGGEADEGHRVDMSVYKEPPSPWVLVYDFQNCAHYYWNANTQESRWTAPPVSHPAKKQSKAK